jgi:hypothetical protein
MKITAETSVGEILGEDKLDKFIDFFGYLYGRWQDEKEYEDFQEYIDAVENRLGLPIETMTKRPFEVVVFANRDWFIYFKATSRQVEWGKRKRQRGKREGKSLPLIYKPKSTDGFTYETYDEYDKIRRENWKSLNDLDKQAKEAGQLVGRYIKHQIADGYAYYQIIKEHKKSVRIRLCEGLGDDYFIQAWGGESTISIDKALSFISNREWLENLGKKGESNG